MTAKAPRILCIEPDPSVLDSRCGILKHHGYDALAASLQLAEVLLASQRIDLIILSAMLKGEEKSRIASAAGKTRILVLEGLTLPSELLSLVAERVRPGQARIA